MSVNFHTFQTSVILVVGGGIAGSSAAIAASRMDSKTLLIEYFGCLGGNAATGLVNSFCGFFTKPNLVPVLRGIGGKIVQAMIDRKAAKEKGWGLSFDPEHLKILLDEKISEAKVNLLYYTQMLDPIVENDLIRGIVIANKADGINPYSLTQATIQGRKVVHELQRFFNEEIPGSNHAQVMQTAAKIGLRETRRVMGEQVLSGEEILQGK
jgi:flavin-dependent dehydrogenase